MSDCLFCAIAAGEIPSNKVFEDDRTFAFLDISPLRRGHVLVIPKNHSVLWQDMDGDDAAAMAKATKTICKALPGLTGDADATIAVNNGPAAGQEVAHVHIHIVPRSPDDGAGPVHALFPDRPTVPENDLQVLAAQFRDALGVAD